MKLLIATAIGPKSAKNFGLMCKLIREAAKDNGIEIKGGIYWTYGQGCCNVAMELVGDEEKKKKFADMLTMGLMPAKWGTTYDDIPAEDTCDIKFDEKSAEPEEKMDDFEYVYRVRWLDEGGYFLESEIISFRGKDSDEASDLLHEWVEEAMKNVENAEDFEYELQNVQ